MSPGCQQAVHNHEADEHEQVLRLRMATSRKISVCGCFLLGGLATVAALVRMTIFIQTGVRSVAMNRQFVLGLPAYDVLGIVSAEMFWAMVETTLAIVAICLPATRKIVNWVFLSEVFGLSALGRYYNRMRSSGRSKSAVAEIETTAGTGGSDGLIVAGWNPLTIHDRGNHYGGLHPDAKKNAIALTSVLRPADGDKEEDIALTAYPKSSNEYAGGTTATCQNCGDGASDTGEKQRDWMWGVMGEAGRWA